LTFEDEDFDVSIIVATEGEDSNTQRLTGLAKENTQLWRDVFAFKESLRTSIIAMLHQYTKLKEVL
jgi:hypothetical protein